MGSKIGNNQINLPNLNKRKMTEYKLTKTQRSIKQLMKYTTPYHWSTIKRKKRVELKMYP